MYKAWLYYKQPREELEDMVQEILPSPDSGSRLQYRFENKAVVISHPKPDRLYTHLNNLLHAEHIPHSVSYPWSNRRPVTQAFKDKGYRLRGILPFGAKKVTLT